MRLFSVKKKKKLAIVENEQKKNAHTQTGTNDLRSHFTKDFRYAIIRDDESS